MGSLKKRVAQIERACSHTDLKALTDQELDAHIGTLDWGVPSGKEVQYWGTPRLLDAVMEKILRHGSSLPIVVDDPER